MIELVEITEELEKPIVTEQVPLGVAMLLILIAFFSGVVVGIFAALEPITY